MEALITALISSGNIMGIVCGLLVYLVIYFQRKSTAQNRDKEITELKTEFALLKQRVESIETVTDTLTIKIDKIIDGINELNIQIARLTTKQENK